MTNITNEVLDTERWRACVDEARKRLDACTVHEKTVERSHGQSLSSTIFMGSAPPGCTTKAGGKSEGSLTR